MTAQDYPITENYGCQPGYPLNTGLCPPGQGYHKGIDYGCPVGTPIVVNGVTIGISGASGAVTGPHLHVGRFVNGKDTNPGVGGGFQFNSAVVTEIGHDDTDGYFVRVQGDGASWVYLHMSNNNLVKVGQELKEENVKPTENQIVLAYKLAFGPEHPPTQQQIQAQLGQPDLSHVLISIEGDSAAAWAALHKQSDDKNAIIDDLQKQSGTTVLKPGTYKVN